MYDYNASYLNEQATLLEEFHKIQKYLIENPLYQIYQSSADYVAGVNEYYINEVSVREGGTLSVGDVVLFSNVYYGVITEINEETEMFTIAEGISFRGARGLQGETGATGETGAPGRDGTNGTDGRNGLSIYLYDGALNDTLTTAYVAQINVPTGYTVKTGDILFSTLETSYGAMSLVTSDAVDFSTVVSIDYIGQLAGASGSKVIRDIDGNIPASALENISVSVGTATNGVTYIRAQMKGEVTYDDNTYDTINYYIDLPIKAGDGVKIEAQPLEGGTGNKQIVISASGGTTLNKYTLTTSMSSSRRPDDVKRLVKIVNEAKGRVRFKTPNPDNSTTSINFDNTVMRASYGTTTGLQHNLVLFLASGRKYRTVTFFASPTSSNASTDFNLIDVDTNGTVTVTYQSNPTVSLTVEYWNDTEITL